MRARRMLLYAALTLLVPLPALAVTRYDATRSADPAGLAVRVALDHCGLLETRILCKLDVSYQPLAGATTYVASVTAPDGSVLDGGELGSSGGSVWVAYAGDGTYSVEVSAFGESDEPGAKPKLIDSDRAEAEGGERVDDGGEAAGEGEGEAEPPATDPEPGSDSDEPVEPPPCPAENSEDPPAPVASDDAAAPERLPADQPEVGSAEPTRDDAGCEEEGG